MADTKVTALSAITPVGTDILYIVDDPGGTPASAKATVAAVQSTPMTGDLVFAEKADHSSTPTAGQGYVWVRNDTPNVPVFTDDAGTDHEFLFDTSGTSLSDKATPVAADTALIFDSAASDAPKTADLQSIVDATDAVSSNTTGVTGADAITNIMSLTTAEYGAITPDSATLYIITDA